MNQADRLRSLITELIESPHSFAIGIGLPTAATIYEVLNGNRQISQKLLKRIIDTYPNINPEWLLKGAVPKLLTDKTRFYISGKVEEQKENYGSKCIECERKDKEISALKDEIIRLLKEASGSKKVSSG